jgi:hypothetical protein
MNRLALKKSISEDDELFNVISDSNPIPHFNINPVNQTLILTWGIIP